MKSQSTRPLLVFDASSHALSLVWFDGKSVQYYRQSVDGKSEKIFKVLKDLKFDAKTLAKRGAIVVGTGPGSFTGNRIAVTAAKTLAHVLRVPLYGVWSTEFIAANSTPSNYAICVMLDAKRNSCFVAIHNSEGIPLGGPRLVGIGDVLSSLQPQTIYTGDMMSKMKEVVVRRFGKISVIRNRTRWYPLPESMLIVARRILRDKTPTINPFDLTPTYLYSETCNVTTR